ncbi:hypothetical protein [Rhodocyclus tenuis]|uniref:Uncharacterized protein n=1 Tax=Rhodocyclus tenuis TaxID=1066 RepID=A0A840G4F5_RHOTE|nr:hypothetical protein [Rhodocyclus tenuis]MBB4247273.1 hypothetical protein [Rhodocyclus tenuis]
MPKAIFPAPLAAMLVASAGKKYRPSNGTEGEIFISHWCFACQRDKALREDRDVFECDDNERCDIVGNTMCYDVEDEKYPKEWRIGNDGQPCCTAFVPAGDPIPTPRCERTLDMFAEAP